MHFKNAGPPAQYFDKYKKGVLKNYWINTSTNYLIHESICGAVLLFREDFDSLISEGSAREARG